MIINGIPYDPQELMPKDELLAILSRYMPLIRKESVIDGVIDEDALQYILLQVVTQIPKFDLYRTK